MLRYCDCALHQLKLAKDWIGFLSKPVGSLQQPGLTTSSGRFPRGKIALGLCFAGFYESIVFFFGEKGGFLFFSCPLVSAPLVTRILLYEMRI